MKIKFWVMVTALIFNICTPVIALPTNLPCDPSRNIDRGLLLPTEDSQVFGHRAEDGFLVDIYQTLLVNQINAYNLGTKTDKNNLIYFNFPSMFYRLMGIDNITNRTLIITFKVTGSFLKHVQGDEFTIHHCGLDQAIHDTGKKSVEVVLAPGENMTFWLDSHDLAHGVMGQYTVRVG